MTTETTLHGYQIILVPRLNVPAEMYVDTPYKDGGKRYSARDLDRWIGQLERELEVMRTAKAMLEQMLEQNAHAPAQAPGQSESSVTVSPS